MPDAPSWAELIARCGELRPNEVYTYPSGELGMGFPCPTTAFEKKCALARRRISEAASTLWTPPEAPKPEPALFGEA